MNLSRGKIGIYVAIVVAAATLYVWFTARDGWGGEDTTVPPPFVTAPADATPILVKSGPLPPTDRHQQAKPVVAADHLNRVVVVAQDFPRAQDPLSFPLVRWRSRDSGESWELVAPLASQSLESQPMGDPWLATDRRGRFYDVYFALLSHGKGKAGLLEFHRSPDAGQTWSPVKMNMNGVSDRPVLGISPNGSLLVIAVAMSKKTADFPTEPLNGDDPQLDAKLAAAFRHFAGIFVSQDRGRNWQRWPGPLGDTHVVPHSVVIDDDGRVASSWLAKGDGTRSVVCSTADRGKTWTETVLAANLQPDRDHPFNGQRFPVVAADGNKNLHAAYIAERAKKLFVRSSKNWGDWLDPIQLSRTDAEEVRMAAIAAWGPMIHVTWMERRGERWQVYYRGSKDHGLAWSDTLLMSKPHADSTLVDNDGFKILGDDDQSSVTDDGRGTAHAVWAVRNQVAKSTGTVWHAVIRWAREQ